MHRFMFGFLIVLLFLGLISCENKPAPAPKAETQAKPAAPELPADDPFLELIKKADTCKPKDHRCVELLELKKFMASYKGYDKTQLLMGLKATQNPNVKGELIRRFKAQVTDEILPDLEPYATDRDFLLRQAAQDTIGFRGTDKGLTLLVSLLDNKEYSETIRTTVPKILARFPEHPVVVNALPKLKDMAQTSVQGWGRLEAMVAVSKIEKEKAIPFLLSIAEKDQWVTVRVRAIQKLGLYYSDETAKKGLKKLSRDKDAKVKKAAEKALTGEYEKKAKKREEKKHRFRPTLRPAEQGNSPSQPATP